MGTKWAKKTLLEVIPPRICVTFRRASFWFRLKHSKIEFLDRQDGNPTNDVSGSLDSCFKKHENLEIRSNMHPSSTYLAENQAF